MKKILAACLGAGVMLLAGCGSNASDSPAKTPTAPSTAAKLEGSTGIVAGQGYDQTCAALMPYLAELESWGQNRVDAAKQVADGMAKSPEWAGLSEQQRTETLRAIDAAGKGKC